MAKTTKPTQAPDAAVCWTVDQFAARWQVNRSTIYNWLASGLLQSVKISGARRILPSHEEAFRARFQSGIQQAGTG